MVNDPAPIKDLAERLEDLVDAVARASTFDAVPEAFRSQWKLTPALYEDIREASDTPERLDDLRRRIKVAFEPLIRDGVLGSEVLPRHEEGSRELAVQVVGEPREKAHIVPRDRIMRERIDKPDNPLGRDFIAAFHPAAPGQGLFTLIADRLAHKATLTYDEPQTNQLREAARKSVADVNEFHARGELLVEQGQEIGEDQLLLLREEHEVANKAMTLQAKARRAASILVLTAAMFALVGYYIHRHEPAIAADLRKIALICGLTVAAIGVARLLAPLPWDAELCPVAIAAMILAIAYNPHFALIVTLRPQALDDRRDGRGDRPFPGPDRRDVGRRALPPRGPDPDQADPRRRPLRARIRRPDLGDGTLGRPARLTGRPRQPLAGGLGPDGRIRARGHPAVRRDRVRDHHRDQPARAGRQSPIPLPPGAGPPGAWDAITTRSPWGPSPRPPPSGSAPMPCSSGSGPISTTSARCSSPTTSSRTRAGAANRHANLAPAMSTLIIIGHVKDGVDLGRQHHLPEPIIDLIEQHHGTTLVEYFFNEATKRCGHNGDGTTVLEGAFRYPGPKPQSKEAGILMVSDAVESASRTLSEPTPARIEGVGPRVDQQAFARRSVRRMWPDPPRNFRDPRKPDQESDRYLPRSGQVPGATDRLMENSRIVTVLSRNRARLDRGRHQRHPVAPGHRPRFRRGLGPPDPLQRRDRPRLPVSIALVDDATIHAINRRHLDHDWPTDVITFVLSDPIRRPGAPGGAGHLDRDGRRDRQGGGGRPPVRTGALSCPRALASVRARRPDAGRRRRDEAEGRGDPRPRRSAEHIPPGWRGAFGLDSDRGREMIRWPLPNLAEALVVGIPLLTTQGLLVSLGRALRTYSRSRLEEVCEANQRPKRADLIAPRR